MGLFSMHNMKNFIGKYKIAAMVVVAGFISNMVVKGFMKSVGKFFEQTTRAYSLHCLLLLNFLLHYASYTIFFI